MAKDKDVAEVEVKPEEVELVVDRLKHVKLQHAHDEYEVIEAPFGWQFDRQFSLNGRNWEHVHDDANGVWCYRAM